MSDAATIAVYARAARRYAAKDLAPHDLDHGDDIAAFSALLPPGGRILDLGCGPGRWAAAFHKAGYLVDATDVTPEMAALARRRYGLTVRVEPFEALSARSYYDGIWANFSLLHSAKSDLPGLLQRLHMALMPGGALHLGMKLGTGEQRCDLGRRFAYYGQDELRSLLASTRFTVTRSRTGNGWGDPSGGDTFVILTAIASG
ncbi:Methyltransferase type 11 [Roseibacterium elongatum DSM 19469]|uniref:Methyltransferase type 11 n=1 Tax=Roseicyclus elongatus DSM 19469 TaxID=1294273 RepID=W8SMX6_9RHOB|nr:class I SAM-dependent methyltransferase [Roseibacterium elongatum]AHM03875.1 Methyltransferase type 11 [Roseibacterium elongatum DSM 19469]